MTEAEEKLLEVKFLKYIKDCKNLNKNINGIHIRLEFSDIGIMDIYRILDKLINDKKIKKVNTYLEII